MTGDLMPKVEAAANYGALREGLCPVCEVPLEVNEGDTGPFGLCPECFCGWRLRGDDIEVVVIPLTSEFARRIRLLADLVPVSVRPSGDQSDDA